MLHGCLLGLRLLDIVKQGAAENRDSETAEWEPEPSDQRAGPEHKPSSSQARCPVAVCSISARSLLDFRSLCPISASADRKASAGVTVRHWHEARSHCPCASSGKEPEYAPATCQWERLWPPALHGRSAARYSAWRRGLAWRRGRSRHARCAPHRQWPL